MALQILPRVEEIHAGFGLMGLCAISHKIESYIVIINKSLYDTTHINILYKRYNKIDLNYIYINNICIMYIYTYIICVT